MFRTIYEFILPRFALFLLHSIRRFSVQTVKTHSVVGTKIFRSKVRLFDRPSGLTVLGVGEGRTKSLANFRATAEAYEIALFESSVMSLNLKYQLNLPFGLGCGLTRKSAILRAYGEYFERGELQNSVELGVLGNELPLRLSRNTPYGSVHVAAVRDSYGNLGTGYGLNRNEASDSAMRSAVRKRDFFNMPVKFCLTEERPSLFRLTPSQGAWLECYWVGHIKV